MTINVHTGHSVLTFYSKDQPILDSNGWLHFHEKKSPVKVSISPSAVVIIKEEVHGNEI